MPTYYDDDGDPIERYPEDDYEAMFDIQQDRLADELREGRPWDD